MLEINLKKTKCSTVEFGKSEKRVGRHYKLDKESIGKKTEENDLRVLITNKLSPERHANN